MDSRSVQNLRPRELVELARTRSQAAFARELGAPLLLIQLQDPLSELALTLLEVSAVPSERLDPSMGYDTVIGSVPDSSPSSGRPPSSGRAPVSFGPSQVTARLLRSVHFAAPLRKRKSAGKSFTPRISVGRARNNDIVLRHPSVSKFHAWLECDEDDHFYLHDADSTNATQVNGGPLVQAVKVLLRPGDELRFGAVDVLFCSAEILWDALAGRPRG